MLILFVLHKSINVRLSLDKSLVLKQTIVFSYSKSKNTLVVLQFAHIYIYISILYMYIFIIYLCIYIASVTFSWKPAVASCLTIVPRTSMKLDQTKDDIWFYKSWLRMDTQFNFKMTYSCVVKIHLELRNHPICFPSVGPHLHIF